MNIDIIEQKRKDKNLTVTKLCEIAEVDRSTYYRMLENPDSTTFTTMMRLVKALNLNAADRNKVLF